MKNSKKLLLDIVVLVVSIFVFYLLFQNWDQVKEFIANLF
jgi:hypothetical protein